MENAVHENFCKIRVHPYYYPSEFARLAQISLSSFNLFNPFNSFNFGCGFAALGPSVVECNLIRACLFPLRPRNLSAFTGLKEVCSTGMDTTAAQQPSLLRRALIGRHPKRTLVRMAILLGTCVAGAKFVLLPIQVQGESMLPTYRSNRWNFVNRLAYVLHEPRRGDVVAIRTSGYSIMYMKRIIGLPGETVAFHQGHAVINGEVLDEPYLKFESNWEHKPRTLGPRQYYCVGDNRSMPQEDHTEGMAERARIVGKLLL